MKWLFYFGFVLFTCTVQATCNESWSLNNAYQDIRDYKVTERASFYSEPNGNRIIKGLFLVSGDHFKSYLVFRNFVFGSYIRKNGSVVVGWLKKEFLTELDSGVNRKVPEVNENDFMITSPGGDIKLNYSYEDFYNTWGACEINKQPEVGMAGNFLYKGGDVYKYFDNYWRGYVIRSSNINFKRFGGDFDTYRITTITVTNKKYITSRGVQLGMSVDAVINAYGPDYNKSKKDDIIYSYKDFKLTFHVEKGAVESIIMDEGIE